jgi:hypothetical protein
MDAAKVQNWAVEPQKKKTAWMVRVRFPAKEKISLFYSVQTGCRAHPTYYGALSPGVEWQERQDDHSPPPNAEDQDCGSMPPRRSA